MQKFNVGSELTGRETVIGTQRFVPRATEDLHGNSVVSATGDTSHQAAGAQCVALGLSTGRGQRGDVSLRAGGWWPGDICHGLSHLRHSEISRAAGN